MKNFAVMANKAIKSFNTTAARYYQQCELHERKSKSKKSCVKQA